MQRPLDIPHRHASIRKPVSARHAFIRPRAAWSSAARHRAVTECPCRSAFFINSRAPREAAAITKKWSRDSTPLTVRFSWSVRLAIRADLTFSLCLIKRKTGGAITRSGFSLGWCRGRDLNPHDRYGQRILSPSRLPIPPPRQPDIKMEAAPGIEPGNKGFAGPCLTTWPRRLVILHKKEGVKIGSR